ncbi:MAG: branched-chain amino acid dehydrogenase, partial [Mucispirillum sp.]|nr:branched-chain amino acid dehydrogenase [Mucispirillum sp.]
MKDKVISVDNAADMLKDGMRVMFGGFLGVGGPDNIVEAVLKKNQKDLVLIANDTAFVDKGIGKLIVNKMVKKVIASHIGTNKETGNQMNSGELDVELSPQGTLAERVRAVGYGLGGVLTPT